MKEYKKTSTTMKKKPMNMSATNDYEDRNSLKRPFRSYLCSWLGVAFLSLYGQVLRWLKSY